mmetsp:Transcript_5060/g.11219  ORF Transcript_5060/g.11219 Transcript_5060/m.11219 type:complete len:280 (+) Transcript_5060:457-1296(+)
MYFTPCQIGSSLNRNDPSSVSRHCALDHAGPGIGNMLIAIHITHFIQSSLNIIVADDLGRPQTCVIPRYSKSPFESATITHLAVYADPFQNHFGFGSDNAVASVARHFSTNHCEPLPPLLDNVVPIPSNPHSSFAGALRDGYITASHRTLLSTHCVFVAIAENTCQHLCFRIIFHHQPSFTPLHRSHVHQNQTTVRYHNSSSTTVYMDSVKLHAAGSSLDCRCGSDHDSYAAGGDAAMTHLEHASIAHHDISHLGAPALHVNAPQNQVATIAHFEDRAF